jgi:hypothetical protein
MRDVLLLAGGCCIAVAAAPLPITHHLDVVVYGGTPAGIAAAIAASAGQVVELVLPESHVGGMTTGGIGWDDIYGVPTNDLTQVYGSSSSYARFTQAVAAHYQSISPLALELSKNGTRHEPHVAEAVLLRMLEAAGVRIRYGARLVRAITTVASAKRDGESTHTITSIVVQLQNRTQLELCASHYIDATYMGDLMAAAGVQFVAGREARATYGEMNGGIAFTHGVDLDGVGGSIFLQGSTGVASPRVPAMSWRMCFTTNTSNMHPRSLSPPPQYNRTLYLGYVADVKAGRLDSVFDAWSGPRALPPTGTKFDMNCNPKSLGFVWAGRRKEAYIDAHTAGNYTLAAALVSEFEHVALGLLHFQQNDPEVSQPNRTQAQQYGLCADEFGDNGNFPYQLYIREARRMKLAPPLPSVQMDESESNTEGRHVHTSTAPTPPTMFTERDMVPTHPEGRPPLRPDSVAVGTFPIDSFPCSEEKPAVAQRGPGASLEGYIGMQSAMVAPNTLPASMMLPPNLTNLAVPVAVGASHVAFSSVRLEPTWMCLGDAVGKLVHLAIQHQLPSLGAVSIMALQQEVVKDGPVVLYTDMWPGAEDGAKGAGAATGADDGNGARGGGVIPRATAESVYTAMQGLGPWGVGDTIVPSFLAATSDVLTRALATHWLYGAIRAANSTVGKLIPALPALDPSRSTYCRSRSSSTNHQHSCGGRGDGADANVEWKDFGSGEHFFQTALYFAIAGVITPKPGADVEFKPDDPVSTQLWQTWVAAAFPDTTTTSSNPTANTSPVTRGDAALLLYTTALAA